MKFPNFVLICLCVGILYGDVNAAIYDSYMNGSPYYSQSYQPYYLYNYGRDPYSGFGWYQQARAHQKGFFHHSHQNINTRTG
uniref:Uncharacterized protein n=1 Tax=Acrobeloides nanus TaxID=290746 RepID=A0A914CVU6_9BILA